jgi:hypothetical protein
MPRPRGHDQATEEFMRRRDETLTGLLEIET